jgi:DNA-binding transcriptional LysR family regulator
MHMSGSALQTIVDFQSIDPTVQIVFRNEEEPEEFARLIRERDLDVALTRKRPYSSEVEWVKAHDLSVSFLVGADSQFAKHNVIDFDRDLHGQTYLSLSRETLQEMAPHLLKAGMTGKYVIPNLPLLQKTITAGEGIFALPTNAVSAMLGNGLVAKEALNFPLEVGTYILYRPNPPQRLRHFISHLKTTYSNS